MLRRVDFREQAEALFDRRFDQNQCGAAREELLGNAWATDAMATIGFCLGARGQFEEADVIFQRLLGLDPENYKALIGRAMIASIAGERGTARQLLKKAEAADPPREIRERLSAFNGSR